MSKARGGGLQHIDKLLILIEKAKKKMGIEVKKRATKSLGDFNFYSA